MAGQWKKRAAWRQEQWQPQENGGCQLGLRGADFSPKDQTVNTLGPSPPLATTCPLPALTYPLLLPTLEESPSWPRAQNRRGGVGILPGEGSGPHTWAPDSPAAGPYPRWPCWHSVACSHSGAGGVKGQGLDCCPRSLISLRWTETSGDGGGCLPPHYVQTWSRRWRAGAGRLTLESGAVVHMIPQAEAFEFWKHFHSSFFSWLYKAGSSDSPPSTPHFGDKETWNWWRSQ